MKTIFDKLYEEVMQDDAEDLKALGVEGGDDDLGGELDAGLDAEVGGEEVTVTLTADQVDCLRAILAQLDGSEESASEDLGDELDADLDAAEGEDLDTEGKSPFGKEEDAEEEAKEEDAEEEHDKKKLKKESTEMKEVPDSAGKSLQGKNNKVGDKTSKLAKSGKADGKVTQTVDGKGKDVPDSAGDSLTKHSANKVKGKIKGGNQEFFGV